MLYSAPFFIAMAWWAGRAARRATRSRGRDWLTLALARLHRLLPRRACSTSSGLQYITASLERLVLFLYPTIVVLLSALLPGAAGDAARGGRARCSRMRASRSSFAHDIRFGRRPRGDAARRRARLRQRARLRDLPRRRRRRHRAPRLPALHRLGDARVDGIRPRPFRADATARPRCACRRRSTRCRSRWRCSRTVLPTWLIAESIRRIGASTRR